MVGELPPVVLRFLSYKETIQNCSPLTVAEYGNDLRTFFKYIVALRGGRVDDETVENADISSVDEEFISQVTAEDVYSFLLYLSRTRNNKAVTRARKLSAVRAFYKYHTQKTHAVRNNPVSDIDSPQIKAALPKYLSLDESINLIDSVSETSRTHERDYAILTLFLNCGMRLSELVGINLSDMASDLSSLVVTGKGSKMRTIYLNTACRAALEKYLAVRTDMTPGVRITDKDALFLSSRGRRISAKTVQWMVKRQLQMSGLGSKGYSTHKLRHTAATLMYNEGNVDVRALKDILGHEQLNTTQIYTHVSDKKLAEAMEANPLSKKK